VRGIVLKISTKYIWALRIKLVEKLKCPNNYLEVKIRFNINDIKFNRWECKWLEKENV